MKYIKPLWKFHTFPLHLLFHISSFFSFYRLPCKIQMKPNYHYIKYHIKTYRLFPISLLFFSFLFSFSLLMFFIRRKEIKRLPYQIEIWKIGSTTTKWMSIPKSPCHTNEGFPSTPFYWDFHAMIRPIHNLACLK